MARHVVIVGILWVALTAVGLGLASLDIFPATGSPEAQDFDNIFRTLMYMGMPVLTFVFVVLGYGMVLWGRRKMPEDDGPVMYGHGWVPRVWLIVTGGLAAIVMITPGLTGLAKLQTRYQGAGWGTAEAPLTIRVTAQRFAFGFDFFEGVCPESAQDTLLADRKAGAELPVEAQNCALVLQVLPAPPPGSNRIKLPLGEETKFEIHSVDVLHSFWIPAFRIKIDAIPGRTTFMTVKPDVIGNYGADPAYRVQCAELCGVNHTIMRARVDVVSQDEFDSWIESGQEAGK
ncbi:MAG: cytochrome c oxidase subunit II [Dehalococcoidia bacterium]